MGEELTGSDRPFVTVSGTPYAPGRVSTEAASVSGYPGDGAQRWPAVHTLDAAVLFRLALELTAGRGPRCAQPMCSASETMIPSGPRT